MARILSVNVGTSQPLIANKKVIQSGIFKSPVEGPVEVQSGGLAGDERSDVLHIGAKDRAVYAYPAEYYSAWREELTEIALPFGTLAENLTTEGILDDQVLIGDHYRVGSAVLVVTQPRMPCYKLAARLNRPDVVQKMVAARRHGFFFSVAQEGTVSAGDSMQLLQRDSASISITDVVALFVGRSHGAELRERAMASKHLPGKWKAKFALRAGA